VGRRVLLSLEVDESEAGRDSDPLDTAEGGIDGKFGSDSRRRTSLPRRPFTGFGAAYGIDQ
jgi:hypothetical protein